MAKGKTIEKTAEKCAVTLEFIKKFVDDNGYPPTVREICAQVGFKSTASAKYYLDKLEEQGAIKKAAIKTALSKLSASLTHLLLKLNRIILKT